MVHLLKSMSTPIVWILALLTFGLILAKCFQKKPFSKLGWFSVLLGTLILYLFSIGPVSNLLVYSLEFRSNPPFAKTLPTLDIVVILDGGFYPPGGFQEYPEAAGVTYSRLFNGVKVFKQSGARTLALCGGDPRQSGETGAEVMKNLALELGVQENRIITEIRSCNTMEHAAELAKLLSPTEKRQIGIVTSALHMLRSEQVFRKQFPKDTIEPIPVNYIYCPRRYNLKSFIPSASALATSTYALHEWTGIVWYLIRY